MCGSCSGRIPPVRCAGCNSTLPKLRLYGLIGKQCDSSSDGSAYLHSWLMGWMR
jgi:hypothetical protein